ncbi:9551_t:CDS:10 [Entrophospora sp. SA101]|nr:9551_t:CDS:10 [Entrophospora sp. SA101]
MKNKENCTIEIIEDNIIDEDDKGIEIIDDPKKCVLYPALLNILADLRIDNETYVNALIGIFMIFWGPIFWASYSDMRSTRRNVFLVALLLLLISSIICAISNRIELLLAMRALQACGSSVAQSVGAGCISDLYIPSERGKHYGVFYIGFFVGVLIGPIVGGSIALNFGWSFNPFVAFKLLKSKNANVVYNRLTKKNNNVSYPELRIHSGWAVSLSTQLILNPQETYLVDAYPESSASIVALNKLFAFISAGIMSVLILPMANALGKEWRENYQIS